jgi:hypothetical protein
MSAKKLISILNKRASEQEEEDDDKDYLTKNEKGYTMVSKRKRPEGTRYYRSSSPSLALTQKMNRFKEMNNPSDSTAYKDLTDEELKKNKK